MRLVILLYSTIAIIIRFCWNCLKSVVIVHNSNGYIIQMAVDALSDIERFQNSAMENENFQKLTNH